MDALAGDTISHFSFCGPDTDIDSVATLHRRLISRAVSRSLFSGRKYRFVSYPPFVSRCLFSPAFFQLFFFSFQRVVTAYLSAVRVRATVFSALVVYFAIDGSAAKFACPGIIAPPVTHVFDIADIFACAHTRARGSALCVSGGLIGASRFLGCGVFYD